MPRDPPVTRAVLPFNRRMRKAPRGCACLLGRDPGKPAPVAGGHELNPLEDGGDALPAADAHGHQGSLAAGAPQLVERLDDKDAAGRPDRMAERDAAAVG